MEGMAAAVTRYAVTAIDPVWISTFRFGIGFLLLLPFALGTRSRWPRNADLVATAALGTLFYGAYFVAYARALTFTTAARGSLGIATLPVLTMLVAAALGKERLSFRKSLGVLTALSGVTIGSLETSRIRTMNAKAVFASTLPGHASATREFAVGDVLGLYVEAYEQLQNATPHTVTFTAELRADGGTSVRKVAEERSSTELQGKRGGYGFNASFRLDGEKLHGGWSLRRVDGRRWLLVKRRDEEADSGDPVAERPESVVSGRTIEELGGR